jgi:hypothetical protein
LLAIGALIAPGGGRVSMLSQRSAPSEAKQSLRRNINLDGFRARGNSAFADDLRDRRDDNHAKTKRSRYLGIDVRDIHAQKDRWLAENPSIKIIETGDIKREPPSLLTRFGGKHVPRFSVLLRYREEA